MTPFEAVYGIPFPNILNFIPSTSRVQVVDDCLHDRDAILPELCRNLRLAQEQMKCRVDQHRREVTFAKVDCVLETTAIPPDFYGFLVHSELWKGLEQ